MAESFRFKAHAWLADRISRVQYPNERAIGRPIFTHAMPWTTRLMLILFGVVTLVFSAGVLFFLGLLAWATITA